MKEIPMLYSTPMVQAILQGRKMMTRRLAAVPNHDHYGTDIMDWGLSEHPHVKDGKWKYSVQSDVDSHNTFELKAKYGKPGDLIWVRETWAPDLAGDDINSYVEYIRYVADRSRRPIKWVKDYSRYNNRPGIHMNKEYARIWLRVTDVKVERLQDISEDDAIAEGVEKINDGAFPYKHYGGCAASCADAKTSFRTLWLEINGDESWDLNPFVWAISFEVLSTTGKPSTLTEKMEG